MIAKNNEHFALPSSLSTIILKLLLVLNVAIGAHSFSPAAYALDPDRSVASVALALTASRLPAAVKMK